ncbi:MAG: hypothetical protein H6623_00170 [Bdellovibrionaceae bacterium]|nr:hypothetical protein [Pseudobdellovibrionaceae bacterium]
MEHVLPMIKTNNGQASIEALLISLTLVFIVFLALMAAYVSMVTRWTDHWNYRAAVCVASDEFVRNCESHLQKKLAILLPQRFFTIEEIWKTNSHSQVVTSIHMGTLFSKKIRANLQLPLQPE